MARRIIEILDQFCTDIHLIILMLFRCNRKLCHEYLQLAPTHEERRRRNKGEILGDIDYQSLVDNFLRRERQRVGGIEYLQISVFEGNPFMQNVFL